MKTIIVPTDFSAQADNAARYAIGIAREMKRDVKLCHALFVPIELPMADPGLWPLEDYAFLKDAAAKQLEGLAVELEDAIDDAAKGPASTHKPAISFDNEIGPVTDVVVNYMADENSSLVVMGISGTGGFADLIMGSKSKDLVDKADFPVLLIPGCAVFKGIKTIIFATDLSEGDIDVIKSIADVARVFKSEIRIYHITGEKYDRNEKRNQADAFMEKLRDEEHYSNIFYHHFRGMNINDGLEWLCEHGKIDLLAMVHRPHSLLYRLLTGCHTHHMARHIKIPLLVFPPDYNTSL
jgi:nucleotide-binding universal stress UspA family protein